MLRQTKQIHILFIFILSNLLGCAGVATKPAEEVVTFVGNFKVHRFKLENGLRLLVVEDHTSPTFAYNTWFRVGSRDEQISHTGLAHLFEHMMFKETKDLKDGEFARILESAGAEGENAFTSRDYTAYVQELPKDKLELIAKLEAERMVNLVVNDQAFKTETEVVQNERRFRNENSPDGLMYQELFAISFTQHPYRWPVIGYQEDLARMSAEHAVQFYRSFYSPNHSTIAVVGDVEPKTVFNTVKKYYGAIKPQKPPEQAIQQEPQQQAPKRKRLPLNIQIEKLLMGYHIPQFDHDDTAAIEVLQAILTGGKSSRLHRALVETGIASAVDSYDLDDKDPSLFIVAVNLQKQKRAAQAEAVILRELSRISKTPVTDKELERAKNRISFAFYEGLNSNSEKANFLGRFETITDNFEKGLQMHIKTQAIKAQDILAVAQKYLRPEGRSTITGVPK